MTDPAFVPFSVEWAAALRAAIERDEAYRAAAARWTWPLALALHATPEFGFPEAIAVELTLDRGHCHAALLLAPADVTAPFMLSADYATWKAVVRGELEVITAVAQRRVTVQGSLATLMLHTRSATALVNCARNVPTRFPDEG